MKFLDAFANVFRIPDLRKRVLFTLGLLAVYRLGGHIPIPGIDLVKWDEMFSRQSGGIFGFFDMFAGGNIRRLTVFALGIMPYITSSIILQLLTVVVPTLEKLSKEGEMGRRKITQWTRYGTIVLSVVQGFGIARYLESVRAGNESVVPDDVKGWGFRLLTVITLTSGTAFIMWLGEQITERGIGNGISLIIFAGIVARVPQAILQTWTTFQDKEDAPQEMLVLGGVMLLSIAFIVFVERASRKIPVHYAK